MFELSWFDLALIVGLAYAWGRYAQWRATLHNLLANPEHFADLLARYSRLKQEDAEQKQAIELRSEWLGDHCYLYRKDTDEFVGQGKTVEAAIGNAARLEPNREYVIPKDMVNKPQDN